MIEFINPISVNFQTLDLINYDISNIMMVPPQAISLIQILRA